MTRAFVVLRVEQATDGPSRGGLERASNDEWSANRTR
jgi:hypothetical protein